ncbi:MAG: flagellar biosynthetic protein FliO [Verrucomicrobia bacterium]|nr:flagellar biosynthetic protein FliO [Verrucomicrobiota bacterium]
MPSLPLAFRLLPNFLADESPSLIDVMAEGQSYNYWGEFVNMIVSLLLVLGFIFFTVWILRRLMGAKLRRLHQDASIQILERRALGQKSSLYLVEVLGRGLVIADSPSGICLIKEFPDDLDIQQLVEQKQEEQVPSFAPIKERLAEKLKNLAIKRV